MAGLDFSTPWLIFLVPLMLIGIPRWLNIIYEALVSGPIGWEAVGAAFVVLITIELCLVLLMRLWRGRRQKRVDGDNRS